jgi:hypothetical protein
MRKSIFNTFTVCFLFFFIAAKSLAADFSIVSGKDRATICIDQNEASVVRKAAGMFQNDVSEITGFKPLLQKEIPSSGNAIITGTLGKSKLLQSVIKKYQLSTDSVAGKWEAFFIQIIERKQGKLLVVMGSDRRGTAYGILELSRLIGISPWIWWADVKPTHKSELSITLNKTITDKPAVQYRGIFLNDEDWGLKPWASKTFEPQVGEIGPKTYGKIFELLLRLRANTIWPAMHECTTPFYFVKGNAAMADSFGIIVSTSHCEPLMRSNPLEWDHKTRGDYNFFTNKKGVIDYWSERLTEASKYENVYTVGMRGIHDGAMEGAKSVQQQVEGLTDVFKEQRSLLQKFLKKNPEEIPQIFIPYKEVLDAYNAGLKVPEDVTLVWCDDNYGYLTRLSNTEEQKRKGGAGVYYHISYWGRPHDYLWLATTQPALIWQEMQRAWAYNARKMWIFNVGDIKPGEYLTEFCLDLAWNPQTVKRNNISAHLEQWMGKTFGAENAAPLKNIMDEYYRLAFIRRPEFMGWSQTEPNTKVKSSDLNFTEFGDEIATRLKQYNQLEQQANELESKISPSLKSAFFELVKYPVTGASQMNKKWLNWQYANLFAANNLSATQLVSQRSLNAYEKIQQMTSYYNDSLENGKWKQMMSFQPRKLNVFNQPEFPIQSANAATIPMIWPEESEKPLAKGDTATLWLNNSSKGIYLFNTESFSIEKKADWISVEEVKAGEYLPAKKVVISAILSKQKSPSTESLLTLNLNGNRFFIKVKVQNNPDDSRQNRSISLPASALTPRNGTDAQWLPVQGLGYSGSAMALQPFNASLQSDVMRNPSLEYSFTTTDADSALIRLYLLPTQPADSKNPLRIAVSIDNSKPQLLSFKTVGRSNIWKENVLRNQAVVKLPWKFNAAGKHSLRIFAVDTDVVLDQVMIDWKMNRQFYGIK